jgi:DinB superfamily
MTRQDDPSLRSSELLVLLAISQQRALKFDEDYSITSAMSGDLMKKHSCSHLCSWLAAVALMVFSVLAAYPRLAAQAQAQPSQQPPPTIASTVDREISAIEKQILEVAEAMPEDKFNFSPESLNIPGSDYKGVRTFAVQVKHIAASNYFIWSPITGDKLPEGLKDGNGPENLKTKADIIKFLKDSFAQGHKAAATLTNENMLQPVGRNNSPRLHLAEFGVAHAYNHYGQMVEYLRMNGIVPPASRTPSD